MNDYKFGNFICQLRTEKGLSQSQLGNMLGLSNKAVSKWEMGVSKPRPDMLVTLANLFGVTVEELLAGERNADTEKKERKERRDNTIKLWTGEYIKKKKRGNIAVLMAILLPIIWIIWVGIIVNLKSDDTILGAIGAMVIILAEAIDIALVFVFLGSTKRMKRLLYATYSDQAEEITALILTKGYKTSMLKLKNTGEINSETKNEEFIDSKDSIIQFLADKYLERKRRGFIAVLISVIIPLVFFIWVSVVITLKLEDKIFGAICTMAILLAEAIDIVFIFVFFGSAKRMKHYLYSTYHDQAEEISALILPKKDKVPMLKWEKICAIICHSIMLLGYIIRLIFISLKTNSIMSIINMVAIISVCLAGILALIVWIHYYMRASKIIKQK